MKTRFHNIMLITLASFVVIMISFGLAMAEELQGMTNPIGMEFVRIQPGAFTMGTGEGSGIWRDEIHRRKVTLTKEYYIGKFEVTQEQWIALMGENPSFFKGPKRPVEYVSWEDVQEFVRKLNFKDEKFSYRLPTEAEWEFAARAGCDKRYGHGQNSASEKLCEYGWYASNSNRETKPVGTLKPNAWGVYDMHGNVSEWCSDWYDENYYVSGADRNPCGPSSGRARVYRGGAWHDSGKGIRATVRNSLDPKGAGNSVGFRLVCTRSAVYSFFNSIGNLFKKSKQHNVVADKEKAKKSLVLSKRYESQPHKVKDERNNFDDGIRQTGFRQ